MGIDVYMEWDGQTEAEKNAQFTGFSVAHGHVGYLREAFHGEPYVTRVLFPDHDEGPIPASTLREREEIAIATAIERERKVYGEENPEDSPMVKSIRDFIALAEKKENETGKPVIVRVA